MNASVLGSLGYHCRGETSLEFFCLCRQCSEVVSYNDGEADQFTSFEMDRQVLGRAKNGMGTNVPLPCPVSYTSITWCFDQYEEPFTPSNIGITIHA